MLNAIADYSKFESRLLADAINEKLTRELRDMKHALCWDELHEYVHHTKERPWRAHDVDEEVIDDIDSKLAEYRMPPHPRADALRPYPVRHFVNPGYVGEDAAREAAEAFYRVTPAYVETLDVEILEDYFAYDNFGAGVMPQDAVASITFFFEECVNANQSSCDLYDYQYSNHKISPLQLDEEGVGAIFGYERVTLPKVTFFIRSEPPWHAINTLEKCRTLCRQLQNFGAETSVVYSYGPRYNIWRRSPRHYDVSPRVGAIDLGAIMNLEVGEWPKHFLGECQKQAPASYG
jgi:hypothetical protein